MREEFGFSCKYYKDIVDAWAPFTRDEEMAFRAKMLSEGRLKEMKDELVLRNVGLISIHGRKWLWLYSAEDAVSIGITGLYEAAETFDYDRTDVRFASYAGWYLTKAFNYRKDEYRNAVDERSVPFDQPVAYTDTAEESDSMSTGDALNKYFDWESLVLKNDGSDMFGFDVEDWMQEKLAASTLVQDAGKREAIRRMMVTRLRHPEYTQEQTAQAAGIVNRDTGRPLTRERARQFIELGKAMLRHSVRDEVAKKMEPSKPDIAEYYAKYGKEDHNRQRVKSRLKWKNGRYEIEDYIASDFWTPFGGAKETTEYKDALRKWERAVDCATDDYFTELFGHRFVGGVPVKRFPKSKSDTADANRLLVGQLMPIRTNRHSAGSY